MVPYGRMIPARAQAQEPLRGVPSLFNTHTLDGTVSPSLLTRFR